MAISKTLKGVSVSITINGIEAKEYKATDEEEQDCPKHTKLIYIESISGTNYAIVSKVEPLYRLKSALEFQIQVDSTKLPVAPLFVPKRTFGTWVRTTDGMEQINRHGKESKRPFKFSEIKLVDTSDINRVRRDANSAKHVGEIKITVFRRQVLEQTNLQTGDYDNSTKLEIAEKAVKGQSLSHGTEFGEAVKSRVRALIFETKPARGAREPAAVFIFRYRSREALQAEHIIPRDQSPDILHGLSEEEIRRIARERLSESEDNKMNIKKELNAGGEVWAKRSTEDTSYIFDLTGDDVVDFEEVKAPKPPTETVDLCGDNEMESGAYGTTDAIQGSLFVDNERGVGNGSGYYFGF
ncbi:hypothetical protein ACLOAV_009168 [Pseudogymnoascus australis]